MTDSNSAAREREPLRTLGEGKFLRLVARGRWEFIERTRGPHAAVIVAATDEGELLLVEQWREAIGANVLELPAGLVGDLDDTDEAAEVAAARELEEETGYRPAKLELLTSGPPSPGMASEIVTFFLASQLTHVGPGGGTPHEQITVHRVPLNMADRWLSAAATNGKIVDPKIFIGLYFLRASGPA